MKFSVAAKSIISAGSAAIVAAENGTRRRERVQDKDDLMKGHQESGDESSKAASLADIDVAYNKFVGNIGLRAGNKKQMYLGASDLGVLFQGHRGRKTASSASTSSSSSTSSSADTTTTTTSTTTSETTTTTTTPETTTATTSTTTTTPETTTATTSTTTTIGVVTCDVGSSGGYDPRCNGISDNS